MADYLQLTRIELVAGPVPGADPLEIKPSSVTVFVGPNNSGKSLALRELEDWCWGEDNERKVLANFEVALPNGRTELESLIDAFKVEPPDGRAESANRTWVGFHSFRSGQGFQRYEVPLEDLMNRLDAGDFTNKTRQWLLRPYVIRLDGRTRFALSDPASTGDLMMPPQNHLWALFQDDHARERVREWTEDAFGLHFVVDPTGMSKFRIRMSERKPATSAEERGLDRDALEFHRNAALISELSDGVQGFVGLISALMSLPHKVLLVDEPEAFLHPPLARRLGGALAQLAQERQASLVVSTHSPDFLFGCVSQVPEVTIIRLTYDQGTASARTLSSDDLRDLMLDPLLRSTRALSGLFHRAVVVTESDTDRAFYDEINRRLQVEGLGIEDVQFVNAQNWQTIHRIVEPLRHLGIPAAAIMDLDAIGSGSASVWERIYKAIGISEPDKSQIEIKRQKCADDLASLPPTTDNQKSYKLYGVGALSEPNKSQATELIDKFAEYGLFVVDVGELERWLSCLNVGGPKNEWLVRVFNALGTDPTAPDYVTPKSDDVWGFIGRVTRWVSNPNRKGHL